MRILLINTNRMVPPIAPVALDYLAATLRADGHDVELLDLCFEPDPHRAIDRRLAGEGYRLVGLSFRNTDDCYYPGNSWFVPDLATYVQRVRFATDARIVIGGIGPSIMPEALLRLTCADAVIAGEGEFAMRRLAQGDLDAPGVVRFEGELVRITPPEFGDLASLPPMKRDFVDNERYYREGGQIGFETKRGCPGGCIYCADPVAKGRSIRLRPPPAVADELAGLAGRGILHLHTCDTEFNRPVDHAMAVCAAIVECGLGSRLRWYAYCTAGVFTEELAAAMRAAGCVGINFGVNSGDDDMLLRLGCDFRSEHIRAAVDRCRRNGIACMLDLLLGGPGETAATVERSIALMREIRPDRVGLSVGVRVYPGTPMAELARREPAALCGAGAGTSDYVAPTYYLSPELGQGIFPLVSRLAGQDPLFFFSDPTAAGRNYNYSGNDVLVDAIARGYRGAYWDILRRLRDGLPPA